jgi:hypothetical protein
MPKWITTATRVSLVSQRWLQRRSYVNAQQKDNIMVTKLLPFFAQSCAALTEDRKVNSDMTKYLSWIEPAECRF